MAIAIGERNSNRRLVFGVSKGVHSWLVGETTLIDVVVPRSSANGKTLGALIAFYRIVSIYFSKNDGPSPGLARRLIEAGLLIRDNGRFYFVMKGERDIGRHGGGSPEKGGPHYVLFDQDGKEYWSIKDLAKSGGLSRVRVQDLIREGKLEAVRPSGREWFVSMDSYRAYLQEGERKRGPKP